MAAGSAITTVSRAKASLMSGDPLRPCPVPRALRSSSAPLSTADSPPGTCLAALPGARTDSWQLLEGSFELFMTQRTAARPLRRSASASPTACPVATSRPRQAWLRPWRWSPPSPSAARGRPLQVPHRTHSLTSVSRGALFDVKTDLTRVARCPSFVRMGDGSEARAERVRSSPGLAHGRHGPPSGRSCRVRAEPPTRCQVVSRFSLSPRRGCGRSRRPGRRGRRA